MAYDIAGNPNQITADVAGCATGTNPWLTCDSSSRLAMLGNQAATMLVMEGSTPRRNISGVESEYADSTFKCAMPCTGKILAIIPKFRGGYGADSIDARYNPEIVIIYEDLDSKKNRNRLELGCVIVTSHHSTHPSFGFKYKQLPALKNLRVGDIVPAGTKFSESPNVTSEGDYAYGIEANVALMSIHPVIEDGIVISRSFAERCAITNIGTRMASWGKKRYPLNLYGDAENYKPFPDIGDVVRPDGLIMALRDYDEVLACTDMSNEALMDHDVIFDKGFYAPPGARVIDIRIMRDGKSQAVTPESMLAQVRKYDNAQTAYYETILRTIETYRKQNNLSRVNFSRPLHRLTVEAIREAGKHQTNVIKTYRASPLDEWTVEITYSQIQVPSVSFKYTDTHGGKGVNKIH